MTLHNMDKYDLKLLIEKVNAWRSRVLTISVTKNNNEKLDIINNFGNDMVEAGEVLKSCTISDL